VYDRRTCTSWKSMYEKRRLRKKKLTFKDHEQTDANTFASWGADLLKCRISLS